MDKYIEALIPSKSDKYRNSEFGFYTQFNEVSFFFEDTKKEQFYFAIFSKLFNNLKIQKVFCLNGKNTIRDHAEINKSRKNVYILDKDFDDLLKCSIKQKNIFYLKCYCIENYLFEIQAIKQTILIKNPTLKQILEDFFHDYDQFFVELVEKLGYLFFLYYLSQKKLKLKIENTKIPPENYFSVDNYSLVDINLILSFKNKLEDSLQREKKKVEWEKEYEKAKEKFAKVERGHLVANISGKYLLFFIKSKVVSGLSIDCFSDDWFKNQLVKYGKFDSLKYLSEGVMQFIKSS